MSQDDGQAAAALEVVVRPDPAAAAEFAAERIAQRARAAIDERGTFAFAVSGGATPTLMFFELSTHDLPWDAIHLFQVDERIAPPGHPERNGTALQEVLLERAGIPESNLHLMPVDEPDLEVAALVYASDLAEAGDGELDLVHLGLGIDGHTASWPAGDPVLESDEDVAVIREFHGWRRMTMTPRVIERAQHVLWLVTGAEKADVVARLVRGDEELAASLVPRDRTTLVVDQPAQPRR